VKFTRHICIPDLRPELPVARGARDRKRVETLMRVADLISYSTFLITVRPWRASKWCYFPRMEHRHEPRTNDALVVSISGIDTTGESFRQKVLATRLSKSGALLSGVIRPMRSGDVLWVEHGGKKSRFRVVWVRDSETPDLIQAAIHLMQMEPCPWAGV
jgi:hypothetical protein